MKDEITRIMKLVQEGKLSPEDAAELIEAFEKAPQEEQDGSEDHVEGEAESKSEPFSGFVEAIEKMGRSVANAVDWNEIASQVKAGTQKGVEAIKIAAEQAKQGKSPFIFFGSSEMREVSLPLDVAPGKTLRVENPAGDVRIFGGEAIGSVSARATLRGHDADEARAKAEQYTLVVEESDHFVLIKQPDVTGLSVDLEIRISGNSPVEVRCQSGDIEVNQCTAGVRLNGSSGDIRMNDVQGAIDISTQSGDVSILDAVATAINIEGKSGDITLENAKGNVNIRTSSGSVRLQRASGKTISIEAVSGDVIVGANEPVDGTVNVRTVNGNANVSMPDGANCRVALSTLRGSVHSDFELAEAAKGESRLTGKLGEGIGSIDLSAVNGNVALKKSE